MFSQRLLQTLEQEVVGQSRAVNTVARALTLALAGAPRIEGCEGPFLFAGPTATGKTHIAHIAARLARGDEERLISINCSQLSPTDPWASVTRQLAPHFTPFGGGSQLALPQGSVVAVDHLEWCPPEVARTIVWAFASGAVALEDGRKAGLGGAVVLISTHIGTREILETGGRPIGFTSRSADEDASTRARIFAAVVTALEKAWGVDTLARLEDIIVFHPTTPNDLPALLDLQRRGLEQRFAGLELTLALDDAAREFLLVRGGAHELRHGAIWLVRAFRRFVEYPVRDLAAGGHLAPGTTLEVSAEAGADRLRFRPAVEAPAD